MDILIGLLFLIGWVAGQLIRWPGEFPVTLLDAAVGIAAIDSLAKICSFAVTPRITRSKPTRSRSGWPRAAASLLRKFANFANSQKISLWIIVILIFSWILGLKLFSLEQALPGGLYLLRFWGYLWVIVNAEKLLAPVKRFIIPALWVFVILAWTQYLFLPDTRFLLQYGWDEHYYRMIGTVLDPNYLGVMLGMIGIYLIYKYTNRQIDKWGKVLLALSFGGLVVTFSRASWLATGIGLSFFVFRKESGMTMKILMGVLIIGLVLYVAPKPGGEGVNLFRTNSIEQRVKSWREGINVWREHPWTGVGFNNYAVAKARGNSRIVTDLNGIDHAGNAPSSSWVLLLATTGIIGTGWLAMVGWLAVRNINRLWIGILVMIGIHSIFNNTMFYPLVLGLLALIKVASAD